MRKMEIKTVGGKPHICGVARNGEAYRIRATSNAEGIAYLWLSIENTSIGRVVHLRRLALRQDDVKELLPQLEHFVEYGELDDGQGHIDKAMNWLRGKFKSKKEKRQ